jgi:hypothetical protein
MGSAGPVGPPQQPNAQQPNTQQLGPPPMTATPPPASQSGVNGPPPLTNASQPAGPPAANATPPPAGQAGVNGPPPLTNASQPTGPPAVNATPPPAGQTGVNGPPPLTNASRQAGQTSAPPPGGGPAPSANSQDSKTENAQTNSPSNSSPDKPEGKSDRPDKIAHAGDATSEVLDSIKGIQENKAAISKAVGAVTSFVGSSPLPDAPAKAIIHAGDTVQNKLFNMNVADSTAFKALSTGASFITAAAEASGRGQSAIAAAADGAATAAIDKIPGLSKFDSAADHIQTAADKISPTLGEVTKVFTDSTPSRTLKGLATAAIDTADNIRRGDGKAIIRNMEGGSYHEPMRGYGMVAEIAVSGWNASMNKITTDAAKGNLGAAAKYGDKLGDLGGRIAPLPLSIIRKYF